MSGNRGGKIGQSTLLIDGRTYRLERCLSSNPPKAVWLARDEGSGASVVIKSAHCGDFRVQRSIDAVQRIRSQHVIEVLATYIDIERELVYLVHPFVDGVDFDQIITRAVDTEALIPDDFVVHLIRDAALGLVDAHQHGVVHRDITPSNLLFSTDGRVVLIDFELAVADDTLDGQRTQQLSFEPGTPLYQAPEQVDEPGRKPAASVDIYGLGVVMYQLLAAPRSVASASELLSNVASKKDEARLSRLFDRIRGRPAGLVQLAAQMMSPNLQQRSSARQLVQALDALQSRSHGLPVAPSLIVDVFRGAARAPLNLERVGARGTYGDWQTFLMLVQHLDIDLVLPGTGLGEPPGEVPSPAVNVGKASDGDLPPSTHTSPDTDVTVVLPSRRAPSRSVAAKQSSGTAMPPGISETRTLPVPRRPGARLSARSVAAMVVGVLAVGACGMTPAIVLVGFLVGGGTETTRGLPSERLPEPAAPPVPDQVVVAEAPGLPVDAPSVAIEAPTTGSRARAPRSAPAPAAERLLDCDRDGAGKDYGDANVIGCADAINAADCDDENRLVSPYVVQELCSTPEDDNCDGSVECMPAVFLSLEIEPWALDGPFGVTLTSSPESELGAVRDACALVESQLTFRGGRLDGAISRPRSKPGVYNVQFDVSVVRNRVVLDERVVLQLTTACGEVRYCTRWELGSRSAGRARMWTNGGACG